VAYSATKDARYEDVQCESCHGAGLEHVTDPSKVQPKASLMAGEHATNGCGECHTDSHHPFVGEWEQSRHSEVNESVTEDLELDYATYSAPGQCGSCHEGKIALKNQFNVNSEFAEKGDTHTLVGITCAVCHDPHGNGNQAQLRMLASSPAPESNLCFKCHNRRAVPSGSTTRNAPHAAQGPTIFGDIGWRPPNFPVEKIYGTHSSEANQGLCATCHMANFSVNDKLTGAFKMSTTGHLFKALPCLDADGVPGSDESCTMTQRSFKGCVASGCHGTESSARGATIAVESRITTLSTELKRLVALAKIKAPGDWKSDTNVTVLEGLDFNSQINEHDLSRGVHNPFLLEALLNASITYAKQYYQVQ
jgi:predicted CXXCH cytochrome family protein